jgi:hypothetical protein
VWVSSKEFPRGGIDSRLVSPLSLGRLSSVGGVDAGSRRQAVENALAHSRTAAGVVDVSSTPSKAQAMLVGGGDLSADETAARVERAADRCWSVGREPFGFSKAVVDHIDAVNRELTDGVVKAGSRYRIEQSDKYPYASPARARSALSVLGGLWVDAERRGDPKEAIDLAAFAVWVVDLWAHPYTDACGRTANIVSAFALARFDVAVPTMPPRDVTIAAAYEGDRLSWRGWRRFFAGLCASMGGSQ